MAEIHDLNPTDASNTARFPEAQAPSTLNNGARALEGLIARYFFDSDTSTVATLSGSVIQITANRDSLTLTGTTSNYVANFMQAFTMGSNPNTGAASINVDGVGPISLRDNKGASLTSSMLPAGTRALVVKDGTNDYFRLVWPDATKQNAVITTRGDIIRGSSGGVAERLALGAAGQALKSNGTDLIFGEGIVQVVSTQTGTVATGTTTIPADNTIPQNTEGTEVMTLAITPKATSNTLRIDVTVHLSNSSANSVLTAALFQDSTAGALAVGSATIATATHGVNISFPHVMTAGTTSSTTFKVRVGGQSAGTTTFNGSGGSQLYGGVLVSSIVITETSPA